MVANAVSLGLETSSGAVSTAGPLLAWVNRIAVSVFVLEIAARILAQGPKFFRGPWNIFDVVVIGVSLLPELGAVSGFRSLRVLRILRVISVFPEMRNIVVALVRAIPAIVSITLLLLVLNYVMSVLMTDFYGSALPGLFGSVGRSMLTLFQLMTLDGWAKEIVGPLMAYNPASLYLVLPYLLVTAFAVLNLVIAVLVDAVERSREEARAAALVEELDELEDLDRQILRELRDLRADIGKLR